MNITKKRIERIVNKECKKILKESTAGWNEEYSGEVYEGMRLMDTISRILVSKGVTLSPEEWQRIKVGINEVEEAVLESRQ